MDQLPWLDKLEDEYELLTRSLKPQTIQVSPDVRKALDAEYKRGDEHFCASEGAKVYNGTPIVTDQALPTGTLRVVG